VIAGREIERHRLLLLGVLAAGRVRKINILDVGLGLEFTAGRGSRNGVKVTALSEAMTMLEQTDPGKPRSKATACLDYPQFTHA